MICIVVMYPLHPAKLLICGTHPVQTNGYSKVVYALAKHISDASPDCRVEASIYGFQKHDAPTQALEDERALPFVHVFDARCNEKPGQCGFGFDELARYVTCNRPDVIVVFNDMGVLCNILDKLKDIPYRKKCKVIAYIDQVYLSQHQRYIQFVNRHADAAIAFTPHWEQNLRKIGITIPTYFLQHGLDTSKVFTIPKDVARSKLGFDQDDFLILNLNRNQPRKRWDKCMQAFAQVVAHEPSSKIRLVIGTELTGAFDILEIYARELGKWGISFDVGMQHLIVMNGPQRMSDADINTLYNSADVGINTCDGEGFGLCNFENAAVGVPQVVPAIGGFLDFFNESSAIMVKPCTTFYVDNSRDHLSGEAQICDQSGFVDGVLAYYKDPVMKAAHGSAARRSILERYCWKDIAHKLCTIVTEVLGHSNVASCLNLDVSKKDIELFLASA